MNEMDRNKQFVLLLTQHQRRILAYIHALVPDWHAAEDLAQETNLILCEKFHEFQLGTDFAAWACEIAYWRIRTARLKFARSKVVFDDRVFEAVAQTAAETSPGGDARHDALRHCLQKLQPRDREMILTRYEPGNGVEEAARLTGRSLVAAYKALGRIRKLLLDCVSLQLASGKFT